MKLIISIVLVAVAACSALPSTPNVHADIYMNILRSPGARIVGGQNAKRLQFPYQVSLEQYGSHVCGGSLVTTTAVITAGHCKVSSSIASFTVVVGQLIRGENNEDVQRIEVKDFIVHPKYPPGQVAANDIAVIILSKAAVITEAVKPIQLASEAECNDLCLSTLSGWGLESSWNPVLPTHLKWIKLPRISNDKCADDLKAVLGTSHPLDDTMICTGSNKGQDESACNGDSGGPLLCGKALVGVVSWGIVPCGYARAPSVFTRICSHRDWLKENIPGLQ